MTVPPAASKVLALLDQHGWTVEHAEPSVGLDTATTLGDPRGDGTRPRVTALVEVESYGLRARHPDGRLVLAAWTRRTEPEAGKWVLALAWRRRHDGEHAPQALATKIGSPSVNALRGYITAPDPAAVLGLGTEIEEAA